MQHHHHHASLSAAAAPFDPAGYVRLQQQQQILHQQHQYRQQLLFNHGYVESEHRPCPGYHHQPQLFVGAPPSLHFPTTYYLPGVPLPQTSSKLSKDATPFNPTLPVSVQSNPGEHQQPQITKVQRLDAAHVLYALIVFHTSMAATDGKTAFQAVSVNIIDRAFDAWRLSADDDGNAAAGANITASQARNHFCERLRTSLVSFEPGTFKQKIVLHVVSRIILDVVFAGSQAMKSVVKDLDTLFDAAFDGSISLVRVRQQLRSSSGHATNVSDEDQYHPRRLWARAASYGIELAVRAPMLQDVLRRAGAWNGCGSFDFRSCVTPAALAAVRSQLPSITKSNKRIAEVLANRRALESSRLLYALIIHHISLCTSPYKPQGGVKKSLVHAVMSSMGLPGDVLRKLVPAEHVYSEIACCDVVSRRKKTLVRLGVSGVAAFLDVVFAGSRMLKGVPLIRSGYQEQQKHQFLEPLVVRELQSIDWRTAIFGAGVDSSGDKWMHIVADRVVEAVSLINEPASADPPAAPPAAAAAQDDDECIDDQDCIYDDDDDECEPSLPAVPAAASHGSDNGDVVDNAAAEAEAAFKRDEEQQHQQTSNRLGLHPEQFVVEAQQENQQHEQNQQPAVNDDEQDQNHLHSQHDEVHDREEEREEQGEEQTTLRHLAILLVVCRVACRAQRTTAASAGSRSGAALECILEDFEAMTAAGNNGSGRFAVLSSMPKFAAFVRSAEFKRFVAVGDDTVSFTESGKELAMRLPLDRNVTKHETVAAFLKALTAVVGKDLVAWARAVWEEFC